MAENNVEESTTNLESSTADTKIKVDESTKNLESSNVNDPTCHVENANEITLESSISDIKMDFEESTVIWESTVTDAEISLEKLTENLKSPVAEMKCDVEVSTKKENIESAVKEAYLNVEVSTKTLEFPTMTANCEENSMTESNVEEGSQNVASSNTASQSQCDIKEIFKKMDFLITIFQDMKKTLEVTQTEVAKLRNDMKKVKQNEQIQSVQGVIDTLKRGLEISPDRINLNVTVTSQNGYSTVQFKVSQKTPLKKMMEAYCQNKRLEAKDVQFMYKDKTIEGSDTPLTLGIKDGDIILATFIRHPSVSYIW